MSGTSLRRFIAAVLVAALCGALILGGAAAAESAGTPDALLDPATSFAAVFLVSLALSLPIVAVAIAVFSRVADRFAPQGRPHRSAFVLALGAAGGVAIAVPVSLLAGIDEWWATLVIGLGWGLPSAASGLLLLSQSKSGASHG